MTTFIQFLGGAFLCLLLILVARQSGLKRELMIYAVGLIFAAVIYVGFVLRGSSGLLWVTLESIGLIVFSLVALLGLRINAWFLALGWAAHAGWDVFLHKVLSVPFVPEWYPFICAGFDLFLAGYIWLRFKGRTRAA